ncbi:MAG: hypothetical protein CMJ80_04485, partial [Planctomycetaceae bacterium]|nr:hypothetical protein [Planctomycetaceae bacterium]
MLGTTDVKFSSIARRRVLPRNRRRQKSKQTVRNRGKMDGVVDATDRDTFVEEILGTVYGDANIDGVFKHDDVVDLFAASEYEDGVAGNSGWRTGDFNGDKEFDSQDIVFIFSRGGYTLIPALPGPESAHR